VEVVFMGDELVPENVINTWRMQKNEYNRLKDAELHIIQGGKDDSEEKFNYVNELYEKNKAELLNKDEQIRLLEEELASLTRNAGRQIPFQDISAEAKVNYENIDELGFSYQVRTDFKKMDTVPVFEVNWKNSVSSGRKEEDTKKMLAWLKLRLQDSTLVIKEVE